MAHRSGAQVALIIEEGVALHLRDGDRESSGAAVSRIMSHADDSVRGWHTLQLHVVNATLQLDMCTTATRPLAPWSKDHGSATAYLVSRSGMQAVLDATDYSARLREKAVGKAPAVGRRVVLPPAAAQADHMVFVAAGIARAYTHTRPLFTILQHNKSGAERASNVFARQYLSSEGRMCEPLLWVGHYPKWKRNAGGQFGRMTTLCDGADLLALSGKLNASGSAECSKLCDELRDSGMRICDGFDLHMRRDGMDCWLKQGCSGAFEVPSRAVVCGSRRCGWRRIRYPRTAGEGIADRLPRANAGHETRLLGSSTSVDHVSTAFGDAAVAPFSSPSIDPRQESAAAVAEIRCRVSDGGPLPTAPIAACIVDAHWDAGLRDVLAHALQILDVPIYWLHPPSAFPDSALLESLWVHEATSQSTDTADAKLRADEDARNRRRIRDGVANSRLQTCSLPITEGGGETFTSMRLDPSFYAQLPSPHVLFFDRDVAFCTGSSRRLSWFIEQQYTLLGAPFDPRSDACRVAKSADSCCCDTGLALLNTAQVSQMLERAKRDPAAPLDRDVVRRGHDGTLLHYAAHNTTEFRLPPPHAAQLFAVGGQWDMAAASESSDWPTPFGVRRPWQAILGQDEPLNPELARLVQQCPEARRLCRKAASTCVNGRDEAADVATTQSRWDALGQCHSAQRFVKLACGDISALYS